MCDFAVQVRVLPSINWIDDLVTDALKVDPGCPYEVMDWVTGCVFDNYTTHRNYSAAHNSDTQGERIDMTNWATVGIPRSVAPHVRVSNVAAIQDPSRAMFKPGFDKYTVIELCHPYHPDLVEYRFERWCTSFAKIKAGTYFERPVYRPPVAHHFHYHAPMRGVLQSSYADVEYELDHMRAHPRHKHSAYVFVGGDGLAINRINHTLARKPSRYLRKAPAVIPIQGEHPHGTDHVLHMGWRPYYPLLGGILTAIGHRECKSDFTVSDFNDYDHAISILIEGVAQYFIHLEQSGMPTLRRPTMLGTAFSRNIDLEWLYHFLMDYGFLYRDLRRVG